MKRWLPAEFRRTKKIKSAKSDQISFVEHFDTFQSERSSFPQIVFESNRIPLSDPIRRKRNPSLRHVGLLKNVVVHFKVNLVVTLLIHAVTHTDCHHLLDNGILKPL